VEYPSLTQYSHRLIRWPNNAIFNLIYRGFKGYTHIFRLKMSSGEIGFVVYLWGILLYRLRRTLGRTF
jgi:anaerobic magnesium-protoporphyrin IX monomethyl ester cyclase